MCNQDEKNAREDEYRQLLIELYKENQNFLNKAIFAISSLAIPLLFKGVSEQGISIYSKYLLTGSLFGFFIVISLQILSLKYARDGCDNGLSTKKDERENSKGLFNTARKYDLWREGIFVLSLFLVIPAFMINITTMEKTMSDSSEPQNKPATINEKVEKSFVPPETLVNENQPVANESDTGSSSSQSSQNNEGKKE